MRVLHFVADGSPGGGTTHVLQLASKLREWHGLTVGLVSEKGAYIIERAGELETAVYEGHFFRHRLSVSAMQSFGRAVADFEPDIIHCHGGRANFISRFAAQTIPVIYTVHGFHHRKKHRVGRVAGAWAERLGIGRASGVIYVCQHDRDVAINERLMSSIKPHRVIHNGIDPPSVRPGFPEVKQTALIGFFGRLVAQKYPEMFIEMMYQLPQGYRAIIVGDGELRVVCESLAEKLIRDKRIEFLGALPRERVLDLLGSVDCIVMPSRWEGLPILLLEALAAGTPVIAAAVGGVPEIIQSGKHGLLVENQAEALARAVLEMAERGELRTEIVRQGRQLVLEKFSEVTMVQQVVDMYSQVLR